MKFIIQGTNLKINRALREWVRKKLEPLKRIHEDLAKKDDLPTDGKEERVDMRVELEKTRPDQRTGRIFRAEAQFKLGGAMFRAESVKKDIRQAVVEVKEDLQRQLRKFKGRQEARFKKGARRAKRKL